MKPSVPPGNSQIVSIRESFTDISDDSGQRVHLGLESKTFQQMSGVRPGERCREHFSHHRLHWDRPSPTIDRGGGAGQYHVWHPSETRCITVPELKRVGSWPDHYTLTGSLSEIFNRVGNSVPPLLMFRVAQHIREHLFMHTISKMTASRRPYVEVLDDL